MKLKDLDDDQLDMLRMDIVFKRAEADGRSPSYSEIADARDTVSYDDLVAEFDGTEFVPGDFGEEEL